MLRCSRSLRALLRQAIDPWKGPPSPLCEAAYDLKQDAATLLPCRYMPQHSFHMAHQPFAPALRGRSSAYAANGQSHRRAQSKAEQFNVIEEEAGLVRVDGVDSEGFIINGDRFVMGPVLCLREHYLSWKVRDLSDVSPDSIAFLDLIRPRADLLLIGTGSGLQRLHPSLVSSLRAKGIAFEALDTPNAIATFNILNQEARKVAGAFLPVSGSS